MRLVYMTAALLLSAPVLAEDRMPTPEERSKIESALTGAGYSGWKSIELDDGRWEVDDAVSSDGKKYDLKLERETFAITSKDLED